MKFKRNTSSVSFNEVDQQQQQAYVVSDNNQGIDSFINFLNILRQFLPDQQQEANPQLGVGQDGQLMVYNSNVNEQECKRSLQKYKKTISDAIECYENLQLSCVEEIKRTSNILRRAQLYWRHIYENNPLAVLLDLNLKSIRQQKQMGLKMKRSNWKYCKNKPFDDAYLVNEAIMKRNT